ncbi:MAG: dihydroorotase [Planctomycetota bacterium]|nr:dihydroorotase [Planctomycetota bacterium]MDA1212236.1 dihydroorotase [Planctomycetota bacterium]
MHTILIRGGRIIDPSQNLDQVGNLYIRDKRIVGMDGTASLANEVIDATGLIVCPGFVDLHVALSEPGFEEDETTASGTAAAVAGGFTSVACLPDTDPVVDNRAAAEFIMRQAERIGRCNVFPLGAVTKDNKGEELAEIGQLVEGGAVAFTDAKRPIANAEIMRRALEYTRMFHRPILNHPQVPELVNGGVMHEGFNSTLLGLKGMPAAAQDIMVGRDIALAEMTEGRVHLMCISTEGSVEQIRRAKARGVNVTAEVAIHHLALTDEAMRSFDPNCKIDPPFRSQEHIDALIAGLKDGTIDVICSDHQPIAEEKKNCEIDLAPFGIIGLETLLPLCVKTLIEPGHLTWLELLSKLTVNPSRILGLEKGTLKPGADADITLIDPSANWTFDPKRFRSASRNTPFGGWEVTGRAKMVLVAGDIRFHSNDESQNSSDMSRMKGNTR